MNFLPPLPPHLQRFVRDQLASGRFRTEGDVVSTALLLLESQSASQGWPASRPRPTRAKGQAGGPSEPSLQKFWDAARPPPRTDGRPGTIAAANPAARRSPRGLLADLRSSLSPEEIREARAEMWAGFPRGAV